jgi:hypothetical protein
VFAPDGRLAASLRRDGLDLVEVAGQERRADVLAGYFAVGEGESFFFPRPAWTPDSTAFLAALPASKELYDPQAQVILWRVPAGGGPPDRLGVFPAFAPSVDFSPDGRFLAAWRRPVAGSSLRELRLLNLETQESVAYAQGELLELHGWAPGSQNFVYTQGPAPGPAHESPRAFLGRLCQPPLPLPGLSQPPLSLRWIDDARFLFLAPTPGPLELRLYTSAGIETLAQLYGEGVEYEAALIEE